MPLCEIYSRTLAALQPAAAPLDGSTMLITGATGAIGRFLVDALAWYNHAAGGRIRILAAGRNPWRLQQMFGHASGVECIAYDATRPFRPDTSADHIIHAACNAHPLAYATDPVGIMRANLLGTLGLLDCARAWNARMLFLSSGEIYGENPIYETGFRETDSGRIDPMNPRACYPESKRAAETLCAGYAAQYGAHAMCARLSHVYGPTVSRENSRADAQFLYRALAGDDIILKSAGSQVRSFTYVADCASALLALLCRGEAGQAYNVANPDSVASIREYAELLAELAGVRLRFDMPNQTEAAGYSKVTRAVLNPEKLMALGWRPAYSLEQGLADTLAIAREQQ